MISKIKYLTAVASIAVGLGVATQAKAEAVVPGSTFDVVIGTYDNTKGIYNYSQLYNVTANTTTPASYNGMGGQISESESVLSTGQTQISISFSAGGDLFLEPGSNDALYGVLAVGAYGDPIDFTAPFNLSDAVLTLTTGNGQTFSGDVLQYISQTQPFNGSFPNATKGGVPFGPVQNANVRRIELDLTNDTVTAVTPEPSSLALLGTGILGVAGLARRRFSKSV